MRETSETFAEFLVRNGFFSATIWYGIEETEEGIKFTKVKGGEKTQHVLTPTKDSFNCDCFSFQLQVEKEEKNPICKHIRIWNREVAPPSDYDWSETQAARATEIIAQRLVDDRFEIDLGQVAKEGAMQKVNWLNISLKTQIEDFERVFFEAKLLGIPGKKRSCGIFLEIFPESA